jgi:TrmH family RNA methyltransferase
MITSTANPTIKQIRKLAERKERQQTGLFYVEGLRIVGEAFDRGWKIHQMIVSPELLSSLFGQQLAQKFQSNGGSVLEVSAEVFRSISSKDGPQGIGAVVEQHWSQLEQVAPQENQLWVALDSIQDPGNLGAILRTLDAVGGQGVILLDQSTDPYDPSAVRGSMGAVFALELVKTSFTRFAEWKRYQQIPMIGSSDKAASDYHYASYPTRFILLMGSERQGLQEHHLALCDQVVRIPMLGRSDSLNLAVATAILLYEVYNHWRDQK